MMAGFVHSNAARPKTVNVYRIVYGWGDQTLFTGFTRRNGAVFDFEPSNASNDEASERTGGGLKIYFP